MDYSIGGHLHGPEVNGIPCLVGQGFLGPRTISWRTDFPPTPNGKLAILRPKSVYQLFAFTARINFEGPHQIDYSIKSHVYWKFFVEILLNITVIVKYT